MDNKQRLILNLSAIKGRIRCAIQKSGCTENITLLAVTKTKPAYVIEAARELGLFNFGENYLQEALEKINTLKSYTDIRWHFIGALQSNKTKSVAENFHWVQSVDRLKIARRLSEQRPKHMPDLNLCIQLNIDEESTKSGVTNNKDLLILAESICALPRLKLRGIMAIPAKQSQQQHQINTFTMMVEKFNWLQEKLLGQNLDTLSMGMSSDFEAAIEAGATMVRVGTALFGGR